MEIDNHSMSFWHKQKDKQTKEMNDIKKQIDFVS